MKKIRLIIILIYISIVVLITISTIIFVGMTFKKGAKLYFEEGVKTEISVPATSEIEKIIEILQRFNVI